MALSKKFGESTTGKSAIALSLVGKILTSCSAEWLEIKPSSDMLNMVARVSTRIFMGEELCRNEDWLNESAMYSACAFNAVEVLRNWPAVLRPWVAPFIPECKETRARIARCREILKPVVTARHAAKARAVAQGEKPPVYDDSLEWFEKEYENYDAAQSQYVPSHSSFYIPLFLTLFSDLCARYIPHDLSVMLVQAADNVSLFRIALSLFAIHTTSDLMSEIMTQIARHPEVLRPLREEVVEVLSRDGLKKTALYNLKLMDSVIKECQRLKPITLGKQGFRGPCHL